MMGTSLILAAFIATFVIILGQPNISTEAKADTSKVDKGSETEVHLRTFFDSIANNDVKNTDTYRNILTGEAMKEQKAFDNMKKEFRFERQRNAEKQDSRYESESSFRKALAVKRDVPQYIPKSSPRPSTHWDDAFNAAERNDFEVVREYVERKPSILKYTNYEEKTLAYYAACNNNFEMMKYLLEKDNYGLYIGDMFGNNIMQRFIEHGNLEVVKYLVEHHKYNIHYCNNRYSGNTPIHHAAEEGQLEILKYFIEEKHGDVNILNDIGDPPLFNAAETPHMHIIKYLFEERGANVTIINNRSQNILFVSAMKNDLIVPKYLLEEKKVPLDINLRDRYENSVLITAVKYVKVKFIRYLLEEQRPDVNLPDNCQRTPLHCAAFRNHLEICKLLVEHGADVHARDKFSNTPLEDAIAEAEVDVVDYLREMQERRTRRSVSDGQHGRKPKSEGSLLLERLSGLPMEMAGVNLPEAVLTNDKFKEYSF